MPQGRAGDRVEAGGVDLLPIPNIPIAPLSKWRIMGRGWREWRALGVRAVGSLIVVVILRYALRVPFKVVEDRALQLVNDDLIGERWSWLVSMTELIIPALVSWVLPVVLLIGLFSFVIRYSMKSYKPIEAPAHTEIADSVISRLVVSNRDDDEMESENREPADNTESMKVQILGSALANPSPLATFADIFGGNPLPTRALRVQGALYVEEPIDVDDAYLVIASSELDGELSIHWSLAASEDPRLGVPPSPRPARSFHLKRSIIKEFSFEIPERICTAGFTFRLVVETSGREHSSGQWSHSTSRSDSAKKGSSN